MSQGASPFVPGAKVAVCPRQFYALSHYIISNVDKVYKRGNFTLVGIKGQWRPSPPEKYTDFWTATLTSAYGNKDAGYVVAWGDEAVARVRLSQHERRLVAVRWRLERMLPKDISVRTLGDIEKLLDVAGADSR